MTTNIPLHKVKALATADSKWNKVLEFKGQPGRRFAVSAYDFSTNWSGAVGTCSIKVTAKGETVAELDNAVISEPTLYWFSMMPLIFTDSKDHLTFWIKSDGTNTIEAFVELLGTVTPLRPNES